MQAGQLRHYVTYQEITGESVDADGQPIDTWGDVGVIPASLRTMNGKEIIQAQQIQAQADHVITHRYQGYPIKASGRYQMDGRTFHIAWVNNLDGRDREILAYVTEQPTP